MPPWKNSTFVIAPSLSEALALRVRLAPEGKTELFGGLVRLTPGGTLVPRNSRSKARSLLVALAWGISTARMLVPLTNALPARVDGKKVCSAVPAVTLLAAFV